MKKILPFLAALIISFSSCGQKPRAQLSEDNYDTYYEIFVGSFYDSDGDGTGDFSGIIKKLDYINDGRKSESSLHVGGIWLMPIMPSPTYHKYDVTDYYAVDGDYGTMEDFENLVKLANGRGVKVIIDLPVNHTSNQHPWFLSAVKSLEIRPCGQEKCTEENLCCEHNPYVNWYNFSKEQKNGYVPLENTDYYYEAQFWSGMPDLNLDNPRVRDEILNICNFWLEKGVSGFRLDAVTDYYTGNTEKNTEFLEFLKKNLPKCYLVGEAWSDWATIKNLYESGIDSLFNFPFASANGTFAGCIRTADGEKLAKAMENSLSQSNISANFISNHDMARWSAYFGSDSEKVKLAATIYLLMPGNAFVYYGEEIAMAGGTACDEDKRAPMVWSLENQGGVCDYPKGTQNIRLPSQGADEQMKDKNSVLRRYIQVINAKNSVPTLSKGKFSALDMKNNSICGYTVSDDSFAYIVLHNLSDGHQTVRVENSELKYKFGNIKYNNDTLTLEKYSSAVLMVNNRQ